MAWKSIFKSLSGLTSPKWVVAAQISRLDWSDAELDRLFSNVLELAGEEGLVCWLTEELPRLSVMPPAAEKKKVITYITEVFNDEDYKPKISRTKYKFKDDRHFQKWLQNLGMGGLTLLNSEGQSEGEVEAITEFAELQDGGVYTDADNHNFRLRIQSLEGYRMYESYAAEDELGWAMLKKLKAEGFNNPVLRPDLRFHQTKEGSQELDVVIFEGKEKAFIGSAKHTLKGTSKVEELIEDSKKVHERSLRPEEFPSYKEFQGRSIGLAIRADHLKGKNEEGILKFCGTRGVDIYTRSGAGLTLYPNCYASGSSNLTSKDHVLQIADETPQVVG